MVESVLQTGRFLAGSSLASVDCDRERVMKRRIVAGAVLLVLSVASVAPALAQDFGRFEGNVQTEWLDPEGDYRRMRLLSSKRLVK